MLLPNMTVEIVLSVLERPLANRADEVLVATSMGSLYVPHHVSWLRTSYKTSFLCSRAPDWPNMRADVLLHITGEEEAFRVAARVPSAVVEPIWSLLLIQPFVWKLDLFEA